MEPGAHIVMDQDRLDSLVSLAAGMVSRRGLLSLALGSGLGSLGSGDACAGKDRGKKRKGKRKNKNPPLHPLGCLGVGKACNGNDELCCPGICQGRKRKKGEKDASWCAGHAVGDCTRERGLCVEKDDEVERCNLPNSGEFCFTSTGT